jgi:hypothetical protein
VDGWRPEEPARGVRKDSARRCLAAHGLLDRGNQEGRDWHAPVLVGLWRSHDDLAVDQNRVEGDPEAAAARIAVLNPQARCRTAFMGMIGETASTAGTTMGP